MLLNGKTYQYWVVFYSMRTKIEYWCPRKTIQGHYIKLADIATLTQLVRRDKQIVSRSVPMMNLYHHTKTNEPWHEETNVLISTWSDTNKAVQLQKMARCLKFRIKEVEGLNYPCSEADLRLRFRICKMLVFSWHGSNATFKVPWRIKDEELIKWCVATKDPWAVKNN